MSEEELKVTIRYGNLEAEFSGPPSSVYREVVSFLEKAIPAYSLARKISFSMDLKDLLETFSEVFAYNEEQGLLFKLSLKELKSISDAILLLALRRHLEYKLGRAEEQSIGFPELESSLPAKRKTIQNNLTKLVQAELLRRLDRGDYAITALGIKHLADKYSRHAAEKPVEE